jgi:hypothetical protein
MKKLLAIAAGLAGTGTTQAAEPAVQTAAEAWAQDAREYARAFGVSEDEANRRVRQQEASVAVTERLRVHYAGRLAGIAIEHQPAWRVSVLLTEVERPADFVSDEGGIAVPVTFRAGAAATREEVLAALERHRVAIAERVAGLHGLAHDPRTGALLVLAREPLLPQAEAELRALVGVPLVVQPLPAALRNAAAVGGSRVEGFEGARRFVCTTSFVVSDGRQAGITTAAHCPDQMLYRGPDGGERGLTFAGQWGLSYRDVQVHTGVGAPAGAFFVDGKRTVMRPLLSWRTRPQTRSGDFVCMRGESSGYACSTVELIDFAPPGELCGGPCAASWVTATGPQCRRGDSGSPVFIGTTALGILKGGAYRQGPGRDCAFYYYMSVDYLPDGWRLVRSVEADAVRQD